MTHDIMPQCVEKHEWRQSRSPWTWAGMWCGCIGQPLTCAEEDRHPEGQTVAAGMFLKQAAPLLTPSASSASASSAFLAADADLCLSSEGSNYWVRGRDAPLFNKATSNHLMTDNLGAWLTRRMEMQSEKVQQWQGENWIRGLKSNRTHAVKTEPQAPDIPSFHSPSFIFP